QIRFFILLAMRSRMASLFFPILVSAAALAQTSAPFAPLEQWKSAIIRGDRSSLAALYSSSPPARISVVTKGKAEISADNDVDFWTELKARRIELKVSQSDSPQPGVRQINFEATIRTAPPGRTLYVLEGQ